MKKNLIFKLCFIVGIFLIILTACDLGTKQWANITFNLEGPAIEQARANSGASSSARYIHPDADYLIFELFSGNTSLSKTTQSITDGKDISIRLEKVPLNDPNLRAEIEVYKNQEPVAGNVLVGYRDYTIGSIGQNTTLTIGIIPKVEENAKALFVEKEDIYIELDILYPDNPFFVWEIKMLSQKGLYTIEAENDLVLYASDGRVYKNTFLIPGGDGLYTRVFYHPKDEPSTYYLASSDGKEFSINSGKKLDQDILVTQKSDKVGYEDILDNLMPVEFETVFGNSDVTSETLSFTIYNPYSQALSFTTKFEKETGIDETGSPISGNDKFSTKGFPASLPPGKSEEFDIIFDPKGSGSFFADFTIQAEGLGNFVLELSGSGSGFN